MLKIGITGQQGFVGSYLYNVVTLLKEEFQLVPFSKAYFFSTGTLSVSGVTVCESNITLGLYKTAFCTSTILAVIFGQMEPQVVKKKSAT